MNDDDTKALSQEENIAEKTTLKPKSNAWKIGLKKALPFVIVGIVCFMAGVGVDRILVGNRVKRNFNNRPGINRSMPNGFPNGRQNNDNQNMPKGDKKSF